MDIFEYRSQNIRDLSINFESHLNMDPKAEDLEFIFRGLEKLLIKEISTLWDIAALEHYISENMIPQGLRWQLPLNIGGEDAHDMMAWEEFLKHCSLNAMNFIVDARKKKLLNINEQIEEYKVKLEPFKNLDDYQELSTLCQKNLKKIEVGIKDKKFKKYQKTKNDYDNKMVFKWNKNSTNQLPQASDADIEVLNTPNPFKHVKSTHTPKNNKKFQRPPGYQSGPQGPPSRYPPPNMQFPPQMQPNPRFPNRFNSYQREEFSGDSYHPDRRNHYQPNHYHQGQFHSRGQYPYQPNHQQRNFHNKGYYQPQTNYQSHKNYYRKFNGSGDRGGNFHPRPQFKPPTYMQSKEIYLDQHLPFGINKENFPHPALSHHPPSQNNIECLSNPPHQQLEMEYPNTPGKRKLDEGNDQSKIPPKKNRES